MTTTAPHTTAPQGRTDLVDVAVVGGGPAGLAAGLALARSRRSVVVLDAGEPRNAAAAGVHAFLTREGTSPQELLRLGRSDVAAYGGEVRSARVVAGRVRADGLVELRLDGDDVVTARRVVVATGIADRLPEVDGLAARWGTDVVHCPFCHGWEVADRRIAVLATGPAALHQALLFGHLTDDLVLLRHTAEGLDEDEVARLVADGVQVVDGAVVAAVGGDRLEAVRLADGSTVAVGALVVAPRFEVVAPLLADLGLELAEHPSGLGLHVVAGPSGETSVPQVWAAGNVADPSAQVVSAIAQGNLTGARVHADLLLADRSRHR